MLVPSREHELTFVDWATSSSTLMEEKSETVILSLDGHLMIKGASMFVNRLTIKRSFYVAHDISSYLLPNKRNAIGVMLGNGWWGQPDGLNRAPILMAQISINGETVVRTDSSWLANNGPITFNTIYDGETYDARLELPGWANANYANSGWTSPSIVNGVDIRNVRLQMIYPIKIVERLDPINITQPQPGVYVYDFGQSNFFNLDSTWNIHFSISPKPLLFHLVSSKISTSNHPTWKKSTWKKFNLK